MNGRLLWLLTVHDACTRAGMWIAADASLLGPRVARLLDFVTTLRGKPVSMITDNGPKVVGLALER